MMQVWTNLPLVNAQATHVQIYIDGAYVGRCPASGGNLEPWAGTSYRRTNEGPWIPAPPRT